MTHDHLLALSEADPPDALEVEDVFLPLLTRENMIEDEQEEEL